MSNINSILYKAPLSMKMKGVQYMADAGEVHDKEQELADFFKSIGYPITSSNYAWFTDRVKEYKAGKYNAESLYSLVAHLIKDKAGNPLPKNYNDFKGASRVNRLVNPFEDFFNKPKETSTSSSTTPVATSTSGPQTVANTGRPTYNYDSRFRGTAVNYTPNNVYDDGYINTSAKISPFSYMAYMTPQGKSQLKAKDVYGQIYNPGGTEATNLSLDKTYSLAEYNTKYKPVFQQLEKDLNSAKTDDERFNIWNTRGQRERQNAFRESFSDEIAGYVGMGYAPTETQLKKTYDALQGDERKNFEKILNENGIKVLNGKIIPGGFYKNAENYNSDTSLYKYYDNMKDTNGKLYNELGIANITDGVWDRRAEAIHKVEFSSVKDRDEYAAKAGFKSFVNNDGDTVWVDPANRNNIIIPVVYRDKKVTKAELEEWNKKADSPYKEGYKDVGTKGIYERWVTEDETPDPNANINDLNRRKNYVNPLPLAVPGQDNLPPNYIPPSMREVKHVQANTIRISPEATLGELANQAKTATTALVNANPYTSAAGVATLQANQANATNQAWMQAEMANQADQRNVENINEQRIMQRDATNTNLSATYEQQAIVGAANLYDEWRNYITNKNQQNLVNYNLQNQTNAFNAMNPNYQIGSLGNIYQTDDEPTFTVMNGQMYMKDPKTGQMVQVKTTTQNDGTTSTTQTNTTKTPGYSNRKKGGLIGSDNLSKFLKTLK